MKDTDTPILVKQEDAKITVRQIQEVADSLNKLIKQFESDSAVKLSHDEKVRILEDRKQFDTAKFVGDKFEDLPKKMRVKARQEVASQVFHFINRVEALVMQPVNPTALNLSNRSFGYRFQYLRIYRGEVQITPEAIERLEKLSTYEIKGDNLKAYRKAEKGMQLLHEATELLGRRSPELFIKGDWTIRQRDFVSPPDVER